MPNDIETSYLKKREDSDISNMDNGLLDFAFGENERPTTQNKVEEPKKEVVLENVKPDDKNPIKLFDDIEPFVKEDDKDKVKRLLYKEKKTFEEIEDIYKNTPKEQQDNIHDILNQEMDRLGVVYKIGQDPQKSFLGNLAETFLDPVEALINFSSGASIAKAGGKKGMDVLKGGLDWLFYGTPSLAKGIKKGSKNLVEALQAPIREQSLPVEMAKDIKLTAPTLPTTKEAQTSLAKGSQLILEKEFLNKIGDSKRPLIEIIKNIEPKAQEFFKLEEKDIPKKSININFSHIKSSDDVKKVIDKVSNVYGAEIDEARRGTITQQQTEKLANLVGMTPEKLLSRRRGEAFTAEQAVGARRVLVSSANELHNLAVKAQDINASQLDKWVFRKQLAVHQSIQAQVAGMTAEAGRALNSFKIDVKETTNKAKQIQQLLRAIDEQTPTDRIAEMITSIDDVEKFNKFTIKSIAARTWDALYEAWINGLLSSPKTHFVNTTSNSLVALWQIPERLLASGISKSPIGSGEVKSLEAVHQAFGVFQGTKDGFRLAAQALKSGEGSDLLTKVEGQAHKSISSEALGISGTVGRGLDFLGEVVRLPGRALMAEDEFFKAVGYRMELNALAYRDGVSKGLKGRELSEYIYNTINDPPDSIKLSAIDAARYQTFTQELGEGGRAGQRFLQKFPVLRVFVPFVRTPVNIVKFAGERTPFAPIMKQVRTDIAAGGARRDLALAKLSLGSLTMMTAFGMAAEGKITGGGPSDKQLKSQAYNTGWKPYSFVIDNNGRKDYYQFNRLEPLGMLFGMAADMSEIWGEIQDGDRENLAVISSLAFANNITSKTWTRGLSEAVNILEDPKRYGPQYTRNFAKTFIPRVVGHISTQIDPTMRITEGQNWLQSHINSIKSQFPGFSSKLPPRRNLWGEPIILKSDLDEGMVSSIYNFISPVTISKEKDSPIDKEILRLQVPLSMPSKQIEGVPLTPKEYDDLLVILNKDIKIEGKNFKEYMEGFIKKDKYQSLSDGPDGSKALYLKNIKNNFVESARMKLLSKNSELRERVEQEIEERNRKLSPQ